MAEYTDAEINAMVDVYIARHDDPLRSERRKTARAEATRLELYDVHSGAPTSKGRQLWASIRDGVKLETKLHEGRHLLALAAKLRERSDRS